MIKDTDYIARVKVFIQRNWVFILTYIFFFYVALRAPTGGDDWEIANWYHNGFLNTLFADVHSWTNLNGRIFNNLGDSMLSFYRVMWNITSPLVHTGTLYFIAKLFKFKDNKFAVLTMFAMLLNVSVQMRAEIHYHVIANISYTICICLIFYFSYLVYEDFDGNGLKLFNNNKLNGLIYCILAFIITLWIENLTIGFMTLLMALLIQTRFEKRLLPQSIKYGFVGGSLGTLVMFSSIGIIKRMNNNMTLAETIEKNLPTVINHLVNSNLVIYLIYLLVALLSIKTGSLLIKTKLIKYIYIIFSGALSLLIFLKEIIQLCADNYFPVYKTEEFLDNNFFNLFGSTTRLPLVIAFILLLSMLIPIFYLEERNKLLVLYAIALFSVAPMLLSPGARNMMLAQYVVIALTGYMASQLIFKKPDCKKLAYIVVMAIVIIRIDNYAFYLEDATQITELRKEIIMNYKVNSIKGANKKDYTLILPIYRDQIFIGNLNSDYYIESIKKNYKLPSQTTVLFDDDFLVTGFKFSKLQNHGYQLKVEQYPRYAENYKYIFRIYKDDELFLTDETDSENNMTVKFTQEGKYTAQCTITNGGNKQKIVYTSKVLEID